MSGLSTQSVTGYNAEIRGPLTIGLVNNMSGARAATEQQFRQLLFAAGVGHDLKLRCFINSPGLVPAGYGELQELLECDVDAVIVTGAEPQSRNLHEEPLWHTISHLVEWAEARGTPAIWSCLAAHAAVRYLDGIDRRPFSKKLSGVFSATSAKVDHPLIRGMETPWLMPHSRWNDLPESDLESAGYTILLKGDEAGVDVFTKVCRAPFLFFQGHPEYDAVTLLREFRRDVRRYKQGECTAAPTLPRHYFSPAAEIYARKLRDLPLAAEIQREEVAGALTELGQALGPAPWLRTSVALYRNWLFDVALRKKGSVAASRKPHGIMTHQPPPEVGLAL